MTAVLHGAMSTNALLCVAIGLAAAVLVTAIIAATLLVYWVWFPLEQKRRQEEWALRRQRIEADREIFRDEASG